MARPRLAVTLGDPRGIGPEVVAKALALGSLDADVTVLGSGERGAGEQTAPRSLPPEDAGRMAAQAVERAVELARAGSVDAIVTGPVHKHALHLAGFRYPGLTELLSHLAGDVDVAMMLAAGPLRVTLVTTHIPLKDVPAAVTTARVVACGRIDRKALREWWGIGAPRLAVCALNPHAGESGLSAHTASRGAPIPHHSRNARSVIRPHATTRAVVTAAGTSLRGMCVVTASR